jgi:hypothetical protein
MRTPLLLLAAALAAAISLPAQDLKAKEAELTRGAVNALTAFANTAKNQRVLTRSKQAYDLIIDHYDPENSTARSALGFHKNKDKWELPSEDKRPKWLDKANNEQRYKVVDEWAKTAQKLGELHRKLGLEMQKAGDERAKFHLERAVYYYPIDKEAHLALGHKEYQGFFGTDDEIAFVKNMKAIETKALELAKKDYSVQALDAKEMPVELKRCNLVFAGSKSEHFKVWTRGTQENADNCVKWAERGLDFIVYLIGAEAAKRSGITQRPLPFAWVGFLWTDLERDQFLQANKQIWEGKTLDEAKRFVNYEWQVPDGVANMSVRLTPAQMHDSLISYVVRYTLGQGHNDALTEGAMHMATWYLMSTSITQFGALPEGTVAGKELRLPESTNWWLRHIRDQAISHTDFPINSVPRERLSSFRNDVRVKSWNFMTWLVARYPEKWLQFFTAVPNKKVIETQEIEQLAEKTFGKKLDAIEDEWRDWARGGSGVASATGYGPPLLPEKPNKEELAVLDRLNQIRGLQLAYAVTGKEFGVTAHESRDKEKDKSKDKDAKDKEPEKLDLRQGQMEALPPCDLDAEASMACEDHSKYLTRYPERHMKWPEAHEENPALEGFSPRGMRAGMRSVIVFLHADGGLEFAKESVDGWIGTVYHRFPLLEHNINRFGYSYIFDNGWSVATLDMGSLEEPYDPLKAPKFVVWPAPGMKDVPLGFDGNEMPNPLDDQPEAERDLRAVGYPVSLQLQREFASTLGDADIQLFEATHSKPNERHLFLPSDNRDMDELKKWKDRRRGAAVAMYKHTPKTPLLKRMEEREVIFGIPKAHLEPNRTYQVEVSMTTNNPQSVFVWDFTTGTQMRGLILK